MAARRDLFPRVTLNGAAAVSVRLSSRPSPVCRARPEAPLTHLGSCLLLFIREHVTGDLITGSGSMNLIFRQLQVRRSDSGLNREEGEASSLQVLNLMGQQVLKNQNL